MLTKRDTSYSYCAHYKHVFCGGVTSSLTIRMTHQRNGRVTYRAYCSNVGVLDISQMDRHTCSERERERGREGGGREGGREGGRGEGVREGGREVRREGRTDGRTDGQTDRQTDR